MFAKRLDEYKSLLNKSQLISQIAVFIVSIFSLLSLYDLIRFFNENPHRLNEFIETSDLLTAIAFQISILMVFVSRFILLFFKTKNFFWISQILWLFGLTLLASYWLFSRPSELPFKFYSTYTTYFLYASRSFDSIGVWYLFLSPLRQIIILLLSFTKEK